MADFLPENINTGNNDYVKALQQNTSKAGANPDNTMGQEDFLMLLTTQLQNQDPSKPMDPTSFVTDLTQMSQLESSNKMNESIIAMATSFQNVQTMQAASLIGKNVQAEGRDFSHEDGQDSVFRLNTEEPLTDVKVLISDEDGKVKELYVSSFEGEKSITWDGLDEAGNASKSGVYSITAYGTDSEGEVASIDTVVGTRVNSVGIGSDGDMTLTLATGEQVKMAAVREISGQFE